MEKKRLIYIVLLLVLIPLIQAKDELYYDDKVYSGQTINISEDQYFFAISTANDKVSVDLPDGSGLIVKDTECETKNYLMVCFNGAELWYQNYSLDKLYYKAAIKMYQVVSEIDLTRTVEDTTLFIGEQTEVKVTIKNGLDRESTDIVYSDPIPKSFEITDVSGCIVKSANNTHNTVNWYGNLDKSLKKECSYKLIALKKSTFKSKAVLEYNNGVEVTTIYSDSSTITVPEHQLKIEMILGNAKIEPGQRTDLNITLKNINGDESVRVTSFEILVPYGLEVKVPSKYLRQDYKKFTWSGSITKNDSKKFSVKLDAQFINDYQLKPKAAFIINNIRKEINSSIGLKVYSPTLTIDYSIDKEELKGSEKADIAIRVDNPSKTTLFRDIELVVESEFPGFEKVVDNLGRLDTMKARIIEIPITAPDIDYDKKYPLNISVSYKSEFNQILRLKQEETITVLGKYRKEEAPVVNETVVEEAPVVNEPSEADEVPVINQTGVTEDPETAKEPEPQEPLDSKEQEVIVLDTEPEKKGYTNIRLIIMSIATVFGVMITVMIITLKGKAKEKKEKKDAIIKSFGKIKGQKEETTSSPRH